MNFLGVLVWIAAIAIALVPLAGLLTDLGEWYKDKKERDYEQWRKREDE